MKKIILINILLFLYGTFLPAQEIKQNVEERLQAFFKEYTTNTVNIGTCKLDSFRIDFRKKKLLIYTNERFAYQPLRPATVDAIYRHLKQILPGPVSYFKITLFANGRSIEDLIPNLYRKEKKDKTRLFNKLEYRDSPWVSHVHTKLPVDWKEDISPFGKVMENIISTTKINGDGNVRACFVQRKTSSHNHSFYPTSYPCWKMPEPTYSPPVNGIRKNKK